MFIYFCYKNTTYGAINDQYITFAESIIEAKNRFDNTRCVDISLKQGTISQIVISSLEKPDPDVQILFHENNFEDIVNKYPELLI